MPLREVIRLSQPFRAIRPISSGVLVQEIDGPSLKARSLSENPVVPSAEIEQRIRHAREEGRQEGERQLGEQLIQQRAEMQQLLDGVVTPLRQAVGQVNVTPSRPSLHSPLISPRDSWPIFRSPRKWSQEW